LNAISLLLVTMALSAVMLLVLISLSHSGVKGIREWAIANAMAVPALALFAGRGLVPDVLTIEIANTLMCSTGALLLAGFRRHLGQPVPWRALLAGILGGLCALVFWHHVHESIWMRIVAMSVLYALFCLSMGLTVVRALPARTNTGSLRRYPWIFSATAAFVIGALYLVRGLVYAAMVAGWSPPVPEPALNLAFFALGTLALPALTLGAVMMANAGLIARARHAADHDHLTGARSRRAFFELAAREQARSLRRGGPLSLLLFDVDHFKRINDTHGHATGDRVLVEIVERAGTVVRGIDTIARLGGEEFAVLLPDTGTDTALLVAERLRRILARAPDAAAKAGIGYTVSMGVATLHPDESIDAMLSRADAALYAAKAGGRNAVVDARGLSASMA
jgi:diguanylate cyclase (GGDEF)-like protein